MIKSECKYCKNDTYFKIDGISGCVKWECTQVNFDLAHDVFNNIEKKIMNKLGFCDCGMPEECIVFIKEFLTLKELRKSKEIDFSIYFKEIDKLIKANLILSINKETVLSIVLIITQIYNNKR